LAQDSNGGLNLSDRGLLIRLTERVSGLSHKIDDIKGDFHQALSEHKKDQEKTETDMENRVRLLERFRWWFIGAVFGAGALSGGVAALVTKLLNAK